MALTRSHPLRQQLDALALRLRGRLPRRLYHYTTAAGLEGIISTGTLRASNARYLNDTAEMLLGLRQTKRILRAQRRKILSRNEDALVDAVVRGMPTLDSFCDRVYAVCFCAKDDLLGQWRGYSNMGGGYSLGFDPALVEVDKESTLKPRLRKVIYDTGAQRAALRDVLNLACAWIKQASRSPMRQSEVDAAADEVLIDLYGLISALKDDSFEAETEWRMTYTPPTKCLAEHLKFFDVGAWLKPFLTITPRIGSRLPLASITCGPSLNAELSDSAVTLLLQRWGYLPMAIGPNTILPVEVRRSKVPFRFSR